MVPPLLAVLAHGGAGADLPPELTPGRLLTGWTFELVPALLVALTAGLYVWGVLRLRRRGDRWPVGRSIAFVGLGMGSAVLATQSWLAVYDDTLLWVHMLQHMVLNMLVPIFMALGAPITLALRALPSRGRRTVLAVLHSRVAKFLTFPAVAGLIFVLNPFVLYFTGYYEATLRHPVLHDLNHLHFVLVGCLWFWPLLGLDPMPRRWPYGFRLIAAFATMPFHAWLGVAILSSTSLIAGDYYESLGRTWGPSLLQDQHIAGGVLWTAGEVVSLIVVGVIAVQWMQHSEREARREDRRLDRLEAQQAAEAQAAAERAAEEERASRLRSGP
jgi:cytochrome c oxidase assembly factor CtaG